MFLDRVQHSRKYNLLHKAAFNSHFTLQCIHVQQSSKEHHLMLLAVKSIGLPHMVKRTKAALTPIQLSLVKAIVLLSALPFM